MKSSKQKFYGYTIIDGVRFDVQAGFHNACPFYSKDLCRYPFPGRGVQLNENCLGPEYIVNGLCPLTEAPHD
jgi:hypothetical protein